MTMQVLTLLLRGILFIFTTSLFVAFVTPDDFQEPIKPICTTLLVFAIWQGAALYNKWQELKKVWQ